MQQLDKWNKELDRLSKKRYKRMDNKLYNTYKDGLKQLKIEIKQYIDAYESLSFSQRLQVERQLQVATQINDVINEVAGKEERLLRSFISDEGTQGYFGTFYALEGAENIQLNFAMLPESYIEGLVNAPVAGKRLSTRLYTNQSQLAQEATNALLQGAFRGEGYAKVAKRVGELTEANYKQALRIARTEGGRVQSTAKQRAYQEAKDKGIDIKKRWLSTLDKKTRHTHQSLDGKTVEIEEEFVSDGGAKAMGPRMFGKPQEDINCRCTTITIVNGIEPELRRDIETKEIIEYRNYREWEKEAVSRVSETKTTYTPFGKVTNEEEAELQKWSDAVKNKKRKRDEHNPFSSISNYTQTDYKKVNGLLRGELKKRERFTPEELEELTDKIAEKNQIKRSFAKQEAKNKLFQEINSYKDAKNLVKKMDASFESEELRTPFDMRVFRKTGSFTEDELFKQIKELKNGNVLIQKSFMSTTVDLNAISDNFNGNYQVVYEIDAPKGTRGLYIGANSAVSYNEKELLLDRGMKMEVYEVDITETTKGKTARVKARIVGQIEKEHFD